MLLLFDSEIGVYLNYGCFVTLGGDVADDEQKNYHTESSLNFVDVVIIGRFSAVRMAWCSA